MLLPRTQLLVYVQMFTTGYVLQSPVILELCLSKIIETSSFPKSFVYEFFSVYA